MSYLNLLIGKPLPEIKCVEVAKPALPLLLSKVQPKGKTMVVLFVSKTSSPWETSAAVNGLEELAFQRKNTAAFTVVSCDSLANAQELGRESDLRLCRHVFAPGAGKEFALKRTPAYIVVGNNGKVLFQSEDEAPKFMDFVN